MADLPVQRRLLANEALLAIFLGQPCEKGEAKGSCLASSGRQTCVGTKVPDHMQASVEEVGAGRVAMLGHEME